MVDISEFLKKPQFQGMTDQEFCTWMIQYIGVAAVPGSSFFNEDVNNLIRLHFAKGEDILEQASERLLKLNEYR